METSNPLPRHTISNNKSKAKIIKIFDLSRNPKYLKRENVQAELNRLQGCTEAWEERERIEAENNLRKKSIHHF